MEITSDTIHGDKDQEERDLALRSFKSDKLKVLITTDVSARGIDIPNVDYVVNYDLPESAEKYVHRVGRTGRGNQNGLALSFCSSEEKELLDEIEENLGKPIARMDISKNEYQEVVAMSEEQPNDWKSLIDQNEEITSKFKKKGKKK